MGQINIDNKTNHEPANIYIAVTGDTDYCDMISILRRLGHQVYIIGWGTVNQKLAQSATQSFNLLALFTEVGL